jgi:hypothetical protein
MTKQLTFTNVINRNIIGAKAYPWPISRSSWAHLLVGIYSSSSTTHATQVQWLFPDIIGPYILRTLHLLLESY